MKFDGVLLGVGGHMHDYAKQIVLENASRKETIATLQAKTDDKGHLQYMPVVTFFAVGGQKISAGDQLKVTASYDNPDRPPSSSGRHGHRRRLLCSRRRCSFAAFRHAAKAPEHTMQDMKDMPNMSHDQ